MRLPLLFALAIVIRLLLIPNPGFEADISFWKSWGLATYDKGIVEGMKVTNNNYPTPFAYTLGGMVWVYSMFQDPHIFNDFWNNTNLLFLTISKLFPILADVGIAAIILYIGKNTKKLGFPTLPPIGYWILSIGYLLSPISIIDGSVWGQIDSVGVFIFLISLLFILKKQPFVGGLIFMLAMMTKLQNMIYGPLFFLFAWQYGGFTFVIQAIAGALAGFLGLNAQFFLTKNADRVLASLTENYDYFPWMSLNAYNLWWIVSGAKGMATSDKLSVIGMVNAKTVGLLLFSGFYLFAMLRQFVKNNLQTCIEGLIIINASFFLFQTQSHDRYAFPLSVFILLLAPFVKNKKLFILLYSLFTVFYFYNLHTALVINYPNNGIPLLSLLTQPFFTMTTSYILLGLFSVFLFSLTKLFVLVPIVVVIILSILNLPLRTKNPISLNKITPFVSEQQYGTRQIDKTVQGSFGGPNTWTRLSVQYAFYRQGIGTHANSKYTYNLNKNFSRFETDFGIDTESGTKASAIFEIYGDDTLLFRSEKMGRFDLPKHVSVTVVDVKNLTLITTDAGDGNTDDHTDWLHPKLWPK
ncbi:MAG: NPCBM/NEW2 domain-containing protein [Patescibacteria group bacterium]